MSLEAEIKALREAVEAQTALMQKMIGNKAAASKDAAAEPEEGAAKKPATRKTAAKKTAAKKAKTVEDVVAAFGEFFNLASNKPERNKMVTAAKPILEHLGAPKFSEIADEQVDEALSLLNPLREAFDEGGVEAVEAVELPFMNEDADDDGDEEDDDII